MNKNLNKLVCAGALMALGFTASAYTIFDNTTAYNTNLLTAPNGLEIGNEVTLGSGWYLTNFQFEYYSSNLTLNAGLGIDVKFYSTNGGTISPQGYLSPGTLIFDSGFFYNTGSTLIPGNGAHDWSYNAFDLYTGAAVPLNTGLAGNKLPTDFFFTITFANMGTNNIQFPLANTSTGTNYGTYWEYNTFSSQWNVYTNSVPANFLVVFQGVPEPSVYGLGVIGSVLLFGVSMLKRKR